MISKISNPDLLKQALGEETYAHMEKVAELTALMLYHSDYKDEFSEAEKKEIVKGAFLHDCGKIYIPKYILYKEGSLTIEERETMKIHPSLGADFFYDNECYYNIIKYHHERIDGSGYPMGLKENEIPLYVQIVSIVDVYEALTSRRSYKKAISPEEAMQKIKNGECGVFSENLVGALKKVIKCEI